MSEKQPNRPGGLPGAELIASLPAIGGGVKEMSRHLGAAQTLGAHQVLPKWNYTISPNL
jgi:hypothetical protein